MTDEKKIKDEELANIKGAGTDFAPVKPRPSTGGTGPEITTETGDEEGQSEFQEN